MTPTTHRCHFARSASQKQVSVYALHAPLQHSLLSTQPPPESVQPEAHAPANVSQ